MQPVAYIPLADGSTRGVFDDGNYQWIYDDDGYPVYGVWFIPRDECHTPIVVSNALPADW